MHYTLEPLKYWDGSKILQNINKKKHLVKVKSNYFKSNKTRIFKRLNRIRIWKTGIECF
jgi:hypothetical protein